MPDDQKPDPIEDVRTGLGLLFRAAKTAIEKLPTKDIEQAVTTSAREVGRVIENVGKTIERDVFGSKGGATPQPRVEDTSKTEETGRDEANVAKVANVANVTNVTKGTKGTKPPTV